MIRQHRYFHLRGKYIKLNTHKKQLKIQSNFTLKFQTFLIIQIQKHFYSIENPNIYKPINFIERTVLGIKCKDGIIMATEK